jgi:hypothetical protein
LLTWERSRSASTGWEPMRAFYHEVVGLEVWQEGEFVCYDPSA